MVTLLESRGSITKSSFINSFKNFFKVIHRKGRRHSPDVFDDIIVKTTSGKEVLLSERWENQTILLKILPRLGCCLCRQETLMLNRIKPILDENDIGLVAVCFEDIDLEEFLKGYWEWEILVDKERKAYKAAGLKRLSEKEVSEQTNDRSILKLDEFVMNVLGIRDTGRGEVNQLGGTFIISKEKGILYEFKPTRLGIFPSIKEICEIVGGDPNDIEEELPSEYIYSVKGSNSSVSSSISDWSQF